MTWAILAGGIQASSLETCLRRTRDLVAWDERRVERMVVEALSLAGWEH